MSKSANFSHPALAFFIEISPPRRSPCEMFAYLSTNISIWLTALVAASLTVHLFVSPMNILFKSVCNPLNLSAMRLVFDCVP